MHDPLLHVAVAMAAVAAVLVVAEAAATVWLGLWLPTVACHRQATNVCICSSCVWSLQLELLRCPGLLFPISAGVGRASEVKRASGGRTGHSERGRVSM